MVLISRIREAKRLENINESVIREMTRKTQKYGAVNLSQGYPGYHPPKGVLVAAKDAIFHDKNKYSITWGIQELREELSGIFKEEKDADYDPDGEITITCGTSEGIISTILSLVDPGDEVLVFQPYYENYVPAIRFAGGEPVFTTIDPEHRIDKEDLKRKINEKTKIVLLNTPHNPSGKVFSKEDIKFLLDLCEDKDALILCDEIYEKIVFHGEHLSPVSLSRGRERTIMASGVSKTYSLTGWRVGYLAAPKDLMRSIRKVHDYNTVCAPTPFQIGAVEALRTEASFYNEMLEYYRRSRDLLYRSLGEIGFKPILPDGAYYMMADISGFEMDDISFTDHLVKNVGVAVVPGSSFYFDAGHDMVRFSFSPGVEEIEKAVSNMKKDL